MGLDTSHKAWSGPYSLFNKFREGIAKCIGIKLREMQGFGGTKEWDESHDLYPLLYHSDCDGELSVEECKRVARGLTAILPMMKGELLDDAKNFCAGCNLAIMANEAIVFG